MFQETAEIREMTVLKARRSWLVEIWDEDSVYHHCQVRVKLGQQQARALGSLLHILPAQSPRELGAGDTSS